jgi:hypothetical protein
MLQWLRRLLFAALLPILMTTAHGADVQIWGRPVEYWLEQLPATPDQSLEAFSEMGTNALPFLIEVLERKPSLLAETADKVRRTHLQPGKLLKKIFGSALDLNLRRMFVASLIGDLGTNGAPAIPALMKVWNDLAEDTDVNQAAESALMSMRDLVAPNISDFLLAAKSTNATRRSVGLAFLGRCGSKADAAIPLLRGEAKQGDPVLASAAAEALWKIDFETNVALQNFSEILTNAGLQEFGIKCLSEMGAAAKPAVPALLAVLENSKSRFRLNAENAVRDIDPAELAPFNAQIKSNAVANLTTLVERLSSAKSAGALLTIKMYGPDAASAVPALVKFIKKGGVDKYEIEWAIDALAEIGPAASPSVPALIAMLSDWQESVTVALGRIGPRAKEALPFLEKALRAPTPAERCRAADAITKIAPQNAAELVPVLQALEHVPPLRVIYPDSNAVQAPVFFRPDPSSNYFRLAAEVSLWRIGLRASPPVAEIISEAQNKDYDHISDWIDLLGDIGPPAASALPALDKILEFDSEAALAIRRIDPNEYDRLNLPGVVVLP